MTPANEALSPAAAGPGSQAPEPGACCARAWLALSTIRAMAKSTANERTSSRRPHETCPRVLFAELGTALHAADQAGEFAQAGGPKEGAGLRHHNPDRSRMRIVEPIR